MGIYSEDLERTADAYRELSGKGGGQFDLFEDGTRVLARLTTVEGKKNRNDKYYPALTLQVVSWPATCKGNYGHPTLFDNMNLTLPDKLSKFADQPQEVRDKKVKALHIWKDQTEAFGLDVAGLLEESEEGVGSFYACAIGTHVIVKLGIEPAKGDYPAKNTARYYSKATDKLMAKYGLSMAQPAEPAVIPF